MAQKNARGPLDGLKVLDLTEHMAGPYCTMILADMGADVIKVERPGAGDSSRAMGDGSERNPYFRYINRNKKSLTLDYKSPRGKEIFLKLVAGMDVLVDERGLARRSRGAQANGLPPSAERAVPALRDQGRLHDDRRGRPGHLGALRARPRPSRVARGPALPPRPRSPEESLRPREGDLGGPGHGAHRALDQGAGRRGSAVRARVHLRAALRRSAGAAPRDGRARRGYRARPRAPHPDAREDVRQRGGRAGDGAEARPAYRRRPGRPGLCGGGHRGPSS